MLLAGGSSEIPATHCSSTIISVHIFLFLNNKAFWLVRVLLYVVVISDAEGCPTIPKQSIVISQRTQQVKEQRKQSGDALESWQLLHIRTVTAVIELYVGAPFSLVL